MSKEAKQLKLAIDHLPKGVHKADIANSVPVAQSTLTHWLKGDRNMHHDGMKPMARFLNDIKFAYSAARKDYGVLSFKDDGTLKDDLFADLIDQKKQETERMEIQAQAFASAIKPDNQKTAKDWDNINKMDKEFPEEISSELKFLIDWYDYNGRDGMQAIEKINSEIGG